MAAPYNGPGFGGLVSTVQNLLKEVYLPPITEQLNNEVFFLSQIEKSSDGQLVGNEIVLPIHKGRSGGIGARGEFAPLPTAGNQVYDKLVYTLTHHYGRIQVSGVAMAKTKAQIGSFLDILKGEMDMIRTDLRKDLARQVWGSSDGNAGGNGRIAQCGTTTASANVVLGSDEPLRKGHIYVGMVIDLGTSANAISVLDGSATSALLGKVTAINVGAKTVTIGTAVTTDNTIFVSRSGNAGGELNGLQTIVSTAANTLGGINAASAGNEYWDNKRDTGGGSLTLDNMQKMWNQIRLAGGDGVNLLLTTPGLQRAYFNLLQSQVRYVEPLKIQSGYDKEALDFNRQPLTDDIDARFGQIYFLNTGAFKNFTNQEWDWLSEDGNILKWVIGYDAWEAALVRRFQVGATRRNNLGVMSGLTDATGF